MICWLCRCWTILFFIGAVHVSHAQSRSYRHFTVDDGLPSSMLYRPVQDSKGYIWLCTDMGLVRFNGYDFEVFTVKDGLPHNDIWDLFEDGKGRLWLSTYGTDICYFENESFFCFKNTKFAEGDNILSFHESDSGQMWVRIANDLFKISGDQLHLSRDLEGSMLSARNVFLPKSLMLTRKINDISIYALSDTVSLFLQFSDIPADEPFFSCKLSGDTLVSFDGIFEKKRIGDQLISKMLRNESISLNQLIVSFPTQENNQLIKLDEHLYNLTSEDYVRINTSTFFTEILPSTSFYKDAEQNFWISNRQGNLYFLSKQSQYAYSYKKEHGIKENNIIALAKGANETIYFGTEGGFLYQIKKGVLRAINLQFIYNDKMFGTRNKELKDMTIVDQYLCLVFNHITAFIPLSEISNTKPIRLNQLMLIQESRQQQFVLPSLKSGFFVNRGGKSVSTYDNQVFICNTSKGFTTYTLTTDTLTIQLYDKIPRSYGISVDQKNKVWLGGANGLFVYKDNQFNQLKEEKEVNNLLTKSVKWLTLDQKGILWVATDGYGIYGFQNGNVFSIPELRDQIVKNIYVDTNNDLWAATNKGVFWLQAIPSSSFSYNVQKITTAFGLASNEVNDVIVDKKTAYIATGKGLTVIDLDNVQPDTIPAPFYITGVKVNGESQPIQTNYELNYLENNLLIDFICLSYKSTGNITYEYKMVGVDTAWQTTTMLQQTYPKLSPGHRYSFQLRAKDINGIYAEPIHSIHFHIRNPWWETIWFKAGSLFVLLLIGSIVFYWRIRWVKQKEMEKTAVNKKFAELELQALQAQMNPHFIFNALQAIQSFVSTNDERATNKYMSDFAKLMRLFLDSSKEKFINLEAELELIELYLGLEQLRFDLPFEYIIDVPSGLSVSTIEIPSMLLQPFLENAVNHGLRYKSGKGQIKIVFRVQDGWLNITIEDNGVGRQKVKEIQARATKSYQSRGMKIIEERLNTLRYVEEYHIQVDVQDVIINEQVEGTRVVIMIGLDY